MSNQVEVGATGRMVDLFIQDATVSTGAGLPNLTISTFSSYYHRSDMTSTSSVTLVSTGTMGTWSSGQFLQINSTFMRGWYQFCYPDGMFVAGSTVALHMYGHPSMAPMVKAIDITRFNMQSSVPSVTRVGVSSFGLPVGVSSFGERVGVSSFGITVGISSNPIGVNVTSYRDTAAVTTFAGYPATYMDLGLTNNSTSTVTWSSFQIGYVSSVRTAGNVSSLYGSALVTSAAGQVNVGQVGVSTFNSPVGVSSFGVRVGVSSFGLAVGISSNPISVDVSSFLGSAGLFTAAASSVAFSSVYWSSVPVTVGAVDVTSFYGSPAVTTAAGTLGVGRVGVSSFGLAVGISSNPIGVNVTSYRDTAAVTTFAGYPATYMDLGLTNNSTSTVNWSSFNIGNVARVGVSSFGLPVGVSSFGLPVGVSSFSSRVGVSSMNIGVDVTSFIGSAGVFTAAASSVAFSSVYWSSVPTAVGAVDVTSFYGSAVVTTAAGILGVGRVGVSSFGLPVGVSSFDIRVGVSSFGVPVGVSTIQVGVSTSWFSGGTVVTSVAGVLASHVTSMRVAVDRQIADGFLGRNVSSGGDGGRTVTEALYFLRNRSQIESGTLTVYQTDDTTSSWTASISSAAGNPLVGIDPS